MESKQPDFWNAVFVTLSKSSVCLKDSSKSVWKKPQEGGIVRTNKRHFLDKPILNWRRAK
jgi:hypothetical protein